MVDVVEDVGSRFCPRSIVTSVDALSFQHSKQPCDQNIVRTAADTAHAAGHVVTLDEVLILISRELATAIGVQHQQRSVLALLERHQDSL